MLKKNEKITVDQAFRAMILFLERYYKKRDSDDIRVLCSSLLLCPDGRTAIPEEGEEWQDCLREAIADENAGKYTIDLPWRK